MDLYRITSLEGFLSLLLTKEERYVNPIDCWEDTYEGYHLHRLDSAGSSREVVRHLYDEVCGGDLDLTVLFYTKLLRARRLCYGQCWSKLADSDAMWRIYAYGNKAVQLVSDKDRINGMVSSSGWDGKCRVSPVLYDLDGEAGDIRHVIKKNGRTDAPFFHKRSAFKHEEEVRVLLYDSRSHDSLSGFQAQALRTNVGRMDPTLPAEERIVTAARELFGEGDGSVFRRVSDTFVTVSVTDIGAYLVGVRVHPLAESWYVGLVERLCDEYGAPFLGRSALYERPC